MALVLILRGLPGAGKTTLANTLAMALDARVVSADNFMQGVEVTPDVLRERHKKCWGTFCDAVASTDIRPLIVDNTNILKWEWERYVARARDFGHIVHLITVEMDAPRQSIHDVPDETLKNMAGKFVLACARELTP